MSLIKETITGEKSRLSKLVMQILQLKKAAAVKETDACYWDAAYDEAKRLGKADKLQGHTSKTHH